MPRGVFFITTDRRGVALFIVLAVVLTVTVLANVILVIVSSHVKMTQHQVHRIQAYYAAQAGMGLAFEQLRSGAWASGTYSLCNSSSCTVNDPDIPYRVDIAIGGAGSGLGNTQRIDASVAYTP